ncbi:hypothetical protein NADFUDRAFT_8044, partial [Nadsonia fulvescens var. elongata DSM 6958]
TSGSKIDAVPALAPASQSVNPFELAIKVWTTINLTQLQKTLDEQGIEIISNQKSSLISRKELATKTKDFKKLPDDSKLTEIKPLLKSYQTEIDNLTKRGKAAESHFLNLYRCLAEAPDPKPLLEASVDSVISASHVTKLAAENTKLSNQLSRYADYEIIKAKLLELEMKSIENTNAKLKAKEIEMKALMDERERIHTLKEEELSSQVQEFRTIIADLRAQADLAESQLANATSSGEMNTETDQPDEIHVAELELVSNALERSNRRALEMENRNLELRQQLEELKSGSKMSEITSNFEVKISDLERDNSLLAGKLEMVQSKINQSKLLEQETNSSLKRDVEIKNKEIEDLRSKIARTSDYDELKRELDIFKAIEFSIDDDETVSQNNNNNNKQSLEKMLLARNKKLESDLTVMRNTNMELTQQLEKLTQQVVALSQSFESAKQLNEKLENDLLRTNNSDTISIAPSMSGTLLHSKSGMKSTTGLNSLIRSVTNDSGILHIITQQRDRFKLRNTELEEDLRKNWATVADLRKELEALKKDNMELYEKARYMSSYSSVGDGFDNTRSHGESALSPSSFRNNNNKYRDAYEEGLTSFQQFKGRETERVISNMSPMERIAYQFTRMVLANRTSRNLFIVYCLVLHVLVMFIMMYGVSV